MRKNLLLITSLLLVTVFAWAREDFYNRVHSTQVMECKADLNASTQPAVLLARSNMLTDGVPVAAVRNDFYRQVLLAQVAELQGQNSEISAGSLWTGPTLLAGNNMITERHATGRRTDFYNQVLLAQRQEFQAGNNSIGAEPTLLAGNNMITGERVVFSRPAAPAAPADFYNRMLAAKVDDFTVDNNAIAPSALEFAEAQPPSIIVPGSMASNLGGRGGSDWYQRTVAVQAELNRRIRKSELSNTF